MTVQAGVALLLLSSVVRAVSFHTDISAAPDLAAYAEQSKAVCEEWYPKINDILFGPGRPLPYDRVDIVFGHQKIVGYTAGNVIHISSDWLKQPHARDYRAVVVHELTHVVQEYVNFHYRTDGWRVLLTPFRPVRIRHSQEYRMGWLSDGIADFVVYRYFTKTLEPELRLDAKGCLTGYPDSIPHLFALQERKVKLGAKAYRLGYTVTAAFLLWLETRKDPAIIRKLDADLSARRYRPRLFQEYCGASLDKLWEEFIVARRPSGP